MSGKSTKLKFFFNLTLLVLGIAVYAGFWYGTTHLAALNAERETEITERERIESQADQVEGVLETTKDLREQVERYVLSGDKVVGFIEGLEALAERVSLVGKVDAVSSEPAVGLNVDRWENLHIVFSTEGSWASTYQFLSLLESLPYKTEMRQVVIQRINSPEKGGVLWGGDFTINVLKRK